MDKQPSVANTFCRCIAQYCLIVDLILINLVSFDLDNYALLRAYTQRKYCIVLGTHDTRHGLDQRLHVMILYPGIYTTNTCMYIHVLMRDEKEGKKKQAMSNKQGKATQHTQGSHFS